MKLKLFIKLTAGIILFITPTILLAAEFAVDYDENIGDSSYIVELKGKIIKGDYNKFVQLIASNHGKFPRQINLNSNGGDAYEAIKLGRLVHASFIKTYTDPFDNCHSACFILWAGGAYRNAFVSDESSLISKIGIHRPKYSNQYFSSLSIGDAEDKYKTMEDKIKDYLTDMRIPQSIIEDMIRTPSDRIKLLNADEIKKLIGQVPVQYEWFASKCGNLTKSEFSDYALRFSHMNYISENNRDIVRESFKEDANKWLALSDGYRNYLEKSYNEMANCRKNLVISERKIIFKSISPQ